MMGSVYVCDDVTTQGSVALGCPKPVLNYTSSSSGSTSSSVGSSTGGSTTTNYLVQVPPGQLCYVLNGGTCGAALSLTAGVTYTFDIMVPPNHPVVFPTSAATPTTTILY